MNFLLEHNIKYPSVEILVEPKFYLVIFIKVGFGNTFKRIEPYEQIESNEVSRKKAIYFRGEI